MPPNQDYQMVPLRHLGHSPAYAGKLDMVGYFHHLRLQMSAKLKKIQVLIMD